MGTRRARCSRFRARFRASRSAIVWERLVDKSKRPRATREGCIRKWAIRYLLYVFPRLRDLGHGQRAGISCLGFRARDEYIFQRRTERELYKSTRIIGLITGNCVYFVDFCGSYFAAHDIAFWNFRTVTCIDLDWRQTIHIMSDMWTFG